MTISAIAARPLERGACQLESITDQRESTVGLPESITGLRESTVGLPESITSQRESIQGRGERVTRKPERQLDWIGLVPFVACHVAVLGAIWSGVTWEALLVCVALYWARMFGVTAGYHRYFAHRAFSTSRPIAFLLAFLAQSTAQKGAIWWAAHHRAHHLYSDSQRDLHSPRQHGFLHSHLGWLFTGSDRTDWKRVRDLARYPELVWLDRYYLVPPILLAVAVWLLFGWSGLFVGFFLSTVLTWHATFFINSLAHVWGSRRFETEDDSRNNGLLAIVTMGEGWHNNHHHWMRSARQGFYWWEIDATWYAILAMEKLGLVWDVQRPPSRVIEEGVRLDRARRV